jgi:hypothetical protein
MACLTFLCSATRLKNMFYPASRLRLAVVVKLAFFSFPTFMLNSGRGHSTPNNRAKLVQCYSTSPISIRGNKSSIFFNPFCPCKIFLSKNAVLLDAPGQAQTQHMFIDIVAGPAGQQLPSTCSISDFGADARALRIRWCLRTLPVHFHLSIHSSRQADRAAGVSSELVACGFWCIQRHVSKATRVAPSWRTATRSRLHLSSIRKTRARSSCTWARSPRDSSAIARSQDFEKWGRARALVA